MEGIAGSLFKKAKKPVVKGLRISHRYYLAKCTVYHRMVFFMLARACKV